MAFWIKIFFGVCRIVIGGRFSGAGHERAAALVRYVQYFVKLRIYHRQISPLSHLARTADAATATLQPIWLGLPAHCAAAVAWKQRIKIEISAASISAPDLCSSVSPVFCSLQ